MGDELAPTDLVVDTAVVEADRRAPTRRDDRIGLPFLQRAIAPGGGDR